VIIPVLIVKHTQSMRTVDFHFDYIILLYATMSNFADVIKMELCVETFNSPFASKDH